MLQIHSHFKIIIENDATNVTSAISWDVENNCVCAFIDAFLLYGQTIVLSGNLHSVQCPGGRQPAEGKHLQTERTGCPPLLLHGPHRDIPVWKKISCLV